MPRIVKRRSVTKSRARFTKKDLAKISRRRVKVKGKKRKMPAALLKLLRRRRK